MSATCPSCCSGPSRRERASRGACRNPARATRAGRRLPRSTCAEGHAVHAIEANGLAKHVGATRAVDGLDLEVPEGSVYGALGPNGAGKTTAIRVLATLLEPTAGQARVFGHDVVTEAEQVRSSVSLTGQFASTDEDLTGAENLELLARLWGHRRTAARQRAGELLDAFGLTEAGGRQVRTYSGGMRRRLDIAASIVVTPRLVLLDEATTGLDPRSRNQVLGIIRALVADGTTVLLTTQYLDEADQIAERIAVIDHGRVIAEGTGAELKASVGSGSVHVRLEAAQDRPAAVEVLLTLTGHPADADADAGPSRPRARRPPASSGGGRCSGSSTSPSSCST